MESSVNASTKDQLNTKKIRSRYRTCLKEISQCFTEAGSINEESVHNLRVNLKRVDALIALLTHSGRKIPARKLKAFRTLFRIAGKLRAKQVEFGIINNHFADDSVNMNYLHQLHESKAKRLSEYSKFLASDVPRPLKRGIELLKKNISHLTKKHVTRYLSTEETKLAKRLKRSIFREQKLHFIRKDLKRYYLNSKMADHQNERIEKMLDLLGNWHDYQIAFDHVVKTIYTGNLTAPESEPVKQIKYQLMTDKESYYEKIVAYYAEHFREKQPSQEIEIPVTG
jgi:hypothetical protein